VAGPDPGGFTWADTPQLLSGPHSARLVAPAPLPPSRPLHPFPASRLPSLSHHNACVSLFCLLKGLTQLLPFQTTPENLLLFRATQKICCCFKPSSKKNGVVSTIYQHLKDNPCELCFHLLKFANKFSLFFKKINFVLNFCSSTL
jgi:hypothetical protein